MSTSYDYNNRYLYRAIQHEVGMQTRALGKTELQLTSIGLGTWAIGGPWDYGWGPQSDADSIDTIQRALDLGINWIDTAPAYGLGHGEEVVGRAIRGRRNQVILATKCGLVWEGESQSVFGRLTSASIQKEAEDSLRRLGTNVIDLYQIHWPNPAEDIEEAWEAIHGLSQQGKVRYGGVSNFGVQQMERIHKIHPIASLQPPYSLLDRAVEAEILPFCKEHELGVIAYGPMAYGLLTGKYTGESLQALPNDDWRCKGARFQEPELSANLDFVAGLRALSQKTGHPVAHLAIAWVLRRPEVTAAIVGARHPRQIEETAGAVDLELSQDIMVEIERLLHKRNIALMGQRPADGP
ncbi:MAG: aldo/keto reductase [Gammaproteobacteria bacterium]